MASVPKRVLKVCAVLGWLAKAQNLQAPATANVFTISANDDANLCLGVRGRAGVSILQLVKCNGQANQLWYFGNDNFQLRWAEDGVSCIDAGVYAGVEVKAGNMLYVEKCKPASQQKWGYDSSSRTIYLVDFGLDAAYCMDLEGGRKDWSTAIQLWGCNSLSNQKWNVFGGIDLRLRVPYHHGTYLGPYLAYDFSFCLDISGGSIAKGTFLQLWKCNGHISQKWIFENDTIKSAADRTKCVDPGIAQKGGSTLMLWDCNGYPQQKFRYDANAMTFYLAESQDDASLCIDVPGGMAKEGTSIDTWGCNGCWNQQWSFPLAIAPAIQEQKRFPAKFGGGDGCPAEPWEDSLIRQSERLL